jgi:integrase
MAGAKRSWGSLRQLRSGRWQAKFLDPDTHLLTPAPQTFASKSAGDRWLARKRAELDTGTATDEKAGSRPLADWWPGYWRSVQSHKARTKAGYGAAWRLRIEPRFGSTPARRIKPAHVDGWIAEMREQGTSASKIIETLGVFKRVMDEVVRDKAIPVNPCALRTSRLPRRPKMERPVLSPTEVERLAMAMSSETDGVLVRLLAWTGARIGEALALGWDDVNLDRKALTIRRSVEDTAGKLIVGPTKT